MYANGAGGNYFIGLQMNMFHIFFTYFLKRMIVEKKKVAVVPNEAFLAAALRPHRVHSCSSCSAGLLQAHKDLPCTAGHKTKRSRSHPEAFLRGTKPKLISDVMRIERAIGT
jgi:hypothetical protein